MAGLASIGGLVSGLDTASIIDQLMRLEAAPQYKLQSQLGSAQTTLKSLQDLNTQVAYIQTQAEALAKADGWTSAKATSSDASVAVSASDASVPGSISVTVNQVAAAHRLTFSTSAAGDANVVSGGTEVHLTVNGETTTIDTGDGTLDGLVAALNGSGTGVSAATVKLDNGEYRLIVSAKETGQAGAFTLTNTDGSDLLGGAAVRAGQDAQIAVGSDLIHSSSNTFADLMPGLRLTVSAGAVGTTVEVDVARDTGATSAKVKELVDAVNQALSQIDRLTSYDPATKTAGALAGNSTVRELRNSLLNAVYPTDGSSMATVGIQTDRAGKLVFDQVAFAEAYQHDPAGVMAKFTAGATAGFAARIDAVATGASDKVTGTITTTIESHNSAIKRIQDSVEQWDSRLERRRTTLERQFIALETALSRMNSQSNWLTGQINALNANNNG